MLYLGLLLILLGIIIGAVFALGIFESKPAGQLYRPETGIKNFLKSKPDTLYLDGSLSEQTKLKVDELAKKYGINDVKSLDESTANITNSIIVSKKENPNLLIVKETIGWDYQKDESVASLDEDSRLLYMIGDDEALQNTADILESATCQLLDKDSVIIKSGLGCEGIRQRKLCSIY